jgi:glycosyltransferase involved in cell wall biosynthesis
MPFNPDRDVLLFFEDYDRDTFFKHDRRIRRGLRRVYHRFRTGRPKVTGFQVWFLLLKQALEQSGCRVHVNDFRLARDNPRAPVGICGYPHILEDWWLPNPAVLGPGLWDHPSQAPNQMEDARFRVYVTTCDWQHDMFARVYGEARCGHWHAGFDLADWPDVSALTKDVDVLIYDKVRWRRDHFEPELIAPLRAALDARGLKHETIRYGRYDYRDYRRRLERCKAMIFLCEHETQGMAYQEAMASNVPILAWDPGIWVDPNAQKYDAKPIPACSVPFFDDTCGDRFRDFAEYVPALERFWNRRATLAPRDYVARELSLVGSATAYRQLLERARSEGVSRS